MKLSTIITAGFVVGVALGALLSLVGIAPGIAAIITLPLKWLTENLHPFPSESLVGLTRIDGHLGGGALQRKRT
jgi:hypothetical protein